MPATAVTLVWLAGFLVAGVRSLIAYRAATAIARRAMPSAIGGAPPGVTVRLSPELSAPALFGIRAPVILLPVEAVRHRLKTTLFTRTFSGPRSRSCKTMHRQGIMDESKCNLRRISMLQSSQRPVEGRTERALKVGKLDQLNRCTWRSKLHALCQMRSPILN